MCDRYLDFVNVMKVINEEQRANKLSNEVFESIINDRISLLGRPRDLFHRMSMPCQYFEFLKLGVQASYHYAS
jgi:hypothetical protein